MCQMRINVTEQSLQLEQAWTLVDSDGEEVSALASSGCVLEVVHWWPVYFSLIYSCFIA